MTNMGNAKANWFWEARLPAGAKPKESDTVYAVEAFIRDKYERKRSASSIQKFICGAFLLDLSVKVAALLMATLISMDRAWTQLIVRQRSQASNSSFILMAVSNPNAQPRKSESDSEVRP